MSNARFIEEPPRSTPVKAETQGLVIGGGSAGVSAAVAAARNGADVILVERLGYLGGLATGGLIILLLTLDDGRGQQVVGGLCQEVTGRLAQRGAAHFPAKTEWGSKDESFVKRDQSWGLVWGHGPHRVRYSVAYDPEEFKFALNQMTEEAGVRLLLQMWLRISFLSIFFSPSSVWAQSVLDNPASDSFQSGIGLISGWSCDTDQITIAIDGQSVTAAYGTTRFDVAAICGRDAVGFGLTVNWNLFGDGVHTVQAFADGVAFANGTVTVTTLGLGEFPQGLAGECIVANFPVTSAETILSKSKHWIPIVIGR